MMATEYRFQVGDYMILSMKGSFEIAARTTESVTLRNMKDNNLVTYPISYVIPSIDRYQENDTAIETTEEVETVQIETGNETLSTKTYTNGALKGYSVTLVACHRPTGTYHACHVYEGTPTGNPLHTTTGTADTEALNNALDWMHRNPASKRWAPTEP